MYTTITSLCRKLFMSKQLTYIFFKELNIFWYFIILLLFLLSPKLKISNLDSGTIH